MQASPSSNELPATLPSLQQRHVSPGKEHCRCAPRGRPIDAASQPSLPERKTIPQAAAPHFMQQSAMCQSPAQVPLQARQPSTAPRHRHRVQRRHYNLGGMSLPPPNVAPAAATIPATHRSPREARTKKTQVPCAEQSTRPRAPNSRLLLQPLRRPLATSPRGPRGPPRAGLTSSTPGRRPDPARS